MFICLLQKDIFSLLLQLQGSGYGIRISHTDPVPPCHSCKLTSYSKLYCPANLNISWQCLKSCKVTLSVIFGHNSLNIVYATLYNSNNLTNLLCEYVK